MQRLADHLGISPGNLTYHFNKKEDLMIAIYDLFQSEIGQVVPQGGLNKPDLNDFNDQMNTFYQLQQRFLFFYLDLLEIERAYAVLANRHYEHIKNQIVAVQEGLRYKVKLGLLVDEEPGHYLQLAQQIWFTAVFWPRQARVRGEEDNLQNMREALWFQIKPFLTVKGKQQLNHILEPSLPQETKT